MDAKKFRNAVLFMVNHWNKENAIKIFGEEDGCHLWKKWHLLTEGVAPYCRAEYAATCMFYSLDDHNLQTLLDYIEEHYKG